MPYLPGTNLTPTNFPLQTGDDLTHQILLIEEQWQRMYPLISYYSLDFTPEPRGGTGTEDPTDYNTLLGTGATKLDPLYNEPVPVGDGQWRPYSPTTPEGESDRYQYNPVAAFNMRIQRLNLDETRKATGDSETRTLTGFSPLSILDTLSITVQSGDMLHWDGDKYRVKEYDLVGFWKNSNVRLYVRFDLETVSEGS